MDNGGPVSPNEFEAGWPTLLGATAAVSTGASMFNYTASFFVTSLQNELSWSRAEIGLGATITMLATAIMLPLMGHLTDRFGPLKIGSAGLAGFAVMCFALASIPERLPVYYGVLMILGIGFAACTAVTFAPLVKLVFGSFGKPTQTGKPLRQSLACALSF